MNLRRIHAALAACLVAVCAHAASLADGPYVVRGARGLEEWRVDAGADGARPVTRPVAANATLAVGAVAGLPSFQVKLRAAAKPAPGTLDLPASTKLLVVADTHGEFEILTRMLMAQRVLDEKLQWGFGRNHLVVLGDVFDRGPNHTEILWLLYGLEAQARKAGGGAHLLLGNHETMVLRGDLRYLHPRYVQSASAFGVPYQRLFDARTVLGQWLRSRPAVLRIGRRLYLHAGISRALVESGLTLAQINDTVRAALSDSVPADEPARERIELVTGPAGPLWYRGYFPEYRDFPTATTADIEAALQHFGVDTILVGHTIVPTITPLYGGKVIAVQVYPQREDAAHVHFETLLIDGSQFRRAKSDGTAEPLVMR